MGSKVLLVTGIGDCTRAEEAAIAYAKDTASTLVVLQVLASNLYHYGHVDLIATRPSKRDFLHHIRAEVVEKGKVEALRLSTAASETGVNLELIMAETEDVPSTIAREAEQGYSAVFVPRQKRRIFPLLERNLCKELRKRIPGLVVVC